MIYMYKGPKTQTIIPYYDLPDTRWYLNDKLPEGIVEYKEFPSLQDVPSIKTLSSWKFVDGKFTYNSKQDDFKEKTSTSIRNIASRMTYNYKYQKEATDLSIYSELMFNVVREYLSFGLEDSLEFSNGTTVSRVDVEDSLNYFLKRSNVINKCVNYYEKLIKMSVDSEKLIPSFRIYVSNELNKLKEN